MFNILERCTAPALDGQVFERIRYGIERSPRVQAYRFKSAWVIDLQGTCEEEERPGHITLAELPRGIKVQTLGFIGRLSGPTSNRLIFFSRFEF